MRRILRDAATLLGVGLLFAGCDGGPPSAEVAGPTFSVGGAVEVPYIVLAAADAALPAVEQRLTGLGATVIGRIPEIGVVLAASRDAGFADRVGRVPGTAGVLPDLRLQRHDPNMAADFVVAQAINDPPNTGDDDPLLNFQWGHAAIDAFDAWDAGYRGAGVRVAVLDAGIDAEHPDLAPNLNAGLSRSFIAGEDWNIPPGFYVHHGTYVSGIIAAADNGFGMIGVAPEAELVAVKVVSDSGTGPVSALLAGLVYAATIDADVINMSLGGYLPLGVFQSDPGFSRFYASLVAAFNRAAGFAASRGATIVVASGNDQVDGDHTASLWNLPADGPHVIAVSATAPVGWGVDPNTDLDRPASYTNFGQSLIDLAGPGGDFAFTPVTQLCTVAGFTLPCFFLDGVFSTINGGWGWADGTSAAAAYVAGVAALVVGKNGGSLDPGQVRAVLTQTADDLGKVGNDAFYGSGRVNAGRAVR